MATSSHFLYFFKEKEKILIALAFDKFLPHFHSIFHAATWLEVKEGKEGER